MLAAASTGCDVPAGRPKADKVDAARATADAAPTGCTRDGNIEALEHAPECMMRCTEVADAKTLAVSVESLGGAVFPGGTGAVTARIKNVSDVPVTLCLRAESAETTGWDRVAGVTAPPPDPTCQRLHFPFSLRTFRTDSGRDINVDELNVGTNVTCTRTIQAVLLPGRSFTKTIAWVALRLPPAPRPWEDDAGHRYYPKAVPTVLGKGHYRLEVDFPFNDAPPELRRASAAVEVLPPAE